MPDISSEDRGYLYGDALFETMRVLGGEVWWLERHHERMQRSAHALGFSPARVEAVFGEVVQAAKAHADGLCRVTLSRQPGPEVAFGGQGGHALRWRELPDVSHSVRLGVEPGLYCPEDEIAEHKTSNYLRSVMARQRAQARGFDDALRVTRSGRVGEAAASNVFLVKRGGLVVTPSVQGLLPGVMRAAVIQELEARGVEVEQRVVMREELAECEECWLTSMGVGVRRVEGIEGGVFHGQARTRELQAWLVERGWR